MMLFYAVLYALIRRSLRKAQLDQIDWG